MAENWNVANPIDHTKIGDLPAKVRNVKTLVVSGMHRFFWQATAPTARYDTTAFDSDDLGSLWIDSDDNKIYILTATTPTWTEISVEIFASFLAAAREIAFADATLTLKNTDAEDTDGGRQSKLIVKGVQSGDEETTLGYIEISHEGSSDDQKGQIRLLLNDGDDDDTPTVVMTIPSTGVAPTMAESTAPAADAQLANKKYVDDHVGHDGDGYVLRDIDGTPTKVYTKYLTGDLAGTSPTSVAHGVTAANILAVSVICYDDTSSYYRVSETHLGADTTAGFSVYYDATDVVITSIGSRLVSHAYRIKIDYTA